MTEQEQEYIIMASGEIITQERVAAWAAASSPPRSTESLLAEMLDTGWLAPVEDFFSAESTPS